jgi:hypothetical protein
MPFTKAWNENSPTGNDNAYDLDTFIQDFKYAIRERLAVGHKFYSDETGHSDVGYHRPGIVGVKYIGTKSAINALTGMEPGAIAYATDENKSYYYSGSAWTAEGGASAGLTGRDYYRGLAMTSNVNSVSVTVDEVILQHKTSFAPLRVTGIDLLSIYITTSGLNGRDTGVSETPSTWYAIWLVSNGTTTGGVFTAVDASAPVLSGYDYVARVGAIYNNASSDFNLITQYGKRVIYGTPISLEGTYPGTYTTKAVGSYNYALTAAVPPLNAYVMPVGILKCAYGSATGTAQLRQAFGELLHFDVRSNSIRPAGQFVGVGSGDLTLVIGSASVDIILCITGWIWT